MIMLNGAYSMPLVYVNCIEMPEKKIERNRTESIKGKKKKLRKVMEDKNGRSSRAH